MKDNRIYSSPFKRLIAFFIDITILGFLGYLTTFLFEDFYKGIGQYGKLLGFLIAGIYFTLLESRPRGQSIGKMILRLKVMDKAGNPLSIKKAFLRYSIWGICYFSNGISFSGSRYETLLASIGTIIFFGTGFILIFLFLFNRRTKQSLHDLVLSSYVVNLKYESPLEPQKINKVLLPLGIIIPVIAFSLLYAFNAGSNDSGIQKLENYRSMIVALPEINSAGVFTGKSTFKSINGDSKTSYYLEIKTVLQENYPEKNDIAIKVADLILKQYPEEKSKDYIIVKVAYGYDIGIWSKSSHISMKLSPESWSDKIREQEYNSDN